jgi:hypothetical protein
MLYLQNDCMSNDNIHLNRISLGRCSQLLAVMAIALCGHDEGL